MPATLLSARDPHLSDPHLSEAATLALRLASAENALSTLTSGQVDAVVDPNGRTYLLRPAQEQLRQSERRLQAMIDDLADAITVVDRGGEILEQSRASVRVLGCEPEDLIGTKVFERVHYLDLARCYSSFFQVIEGFQRSARERFRYRDGQGSYRLVEATISNLNDQPRAKVVFCFRTVDRPERNTGLAATNDTERFLTMMSHELRTPLAPIIIGLDLLQQDGRFADAQPHLSVIRRNLEVELRLLDDLFDYATFGRDEVRIQLEAVNAHEAVHSVLQICQHHLDAVEIGVQLALAAVRSVVLADSVRLQQVMWNLVLNAIKFSPVGGTISIGTFNDPSGGLTIEVIDRGIGLSPEMLPRVFDAVLQPGGPPQRHLGGFGLGLFIAKGMAEAQQASLTVSSQGIGRGTTFQLTFPTSSSHLEDLS